ncbi:MAG: YicC family protein, partial [Lachnospiraceae bacterium]|nr:YicC family protein [Lachnospiraceae bacterium]
SRFPEVFTMEELEVDEDALFSELSVVIEDACKKFVEAREVEGEKLKEDLLVKLDEMKGYVDFIEKRSPQIIEEYKNKLVEKIEMLLGDNKIDESRIAQEVTIYADKVCVDEEIVRLKSHIDAMRSALLSGDSVGRKLDFIAQEMNREANTTLSKSTDLEITNIGIELKTLIEKIREQIQNIE